MDLYEIVDQVAALVQQRGQVTYRSLKRQFALDNNYFEDLKAELLYTHSEIVNDEGRGFKWAGNEQKGERVKRENGNTDGEKGKWAKGRKEDAPSQWTPPHLAERIRATTITDGERKTITALFADLKGSTALIEGLDPEEARAIIDPALQLMMDAVHRYDGYVAQALGDGIFALFGAPLAHEDHPQRALYAALRMQEEMRRYADTLRAKGYPPLLMRVGINTGEVVLRSIRKDDLHADYVPVGHSTNLAARMEQLAAPGSILVTTYTHKLTDGYFEFKNLGQTQIKGVEEPLYVYEVLGAGPLHTRLQVTARRRGLTRFVGRQTELAQMQRALEHAKAGHGQVVGVMGEPGLGKSRLFYEFRSVAQAGCLILEAYSVSHGKASPYLPVIELLKSYFDITPSDDERKRREKVTGKVLTLDRSLEDILAYLFALLGIEEQPLAPFGKAEAEEFLDILLDEFGSPLPTRERDRVRVEANALPQLKQLILEKTEGTPFFMEEIVQELRERDLLSDPRRMGTAHLQVLPTTVQGILAARIDRLAPEEKALLQQLAVIGREFPVSLIRQVITQPEDELYRLLASSAKSFSTNSPRFPRWSTFSSMR